MPLDTAAAFWRRETASRAAVFIDVADYFTAAREAMRLARRSIHFLNWAFDADTPLDPRAGGVKPEEPIGNLLKALCAERPELDIRILCWDSAFPIAATQNFFPLVDRHAFRDTPVRLVLDSKLPMGSCHHQKMIVIDDAVAFVGGADIGPDRWDTPAHADDDPRRVKDRRTGARFPSRHEVMSLVDGPAAAALGDLFRARWLRATGETLAQAEPTAADIWPTCVSPRMHEVQMGISRTMAAWRKEPGIREVEHLTLASIASARTCIYMENQYFTSPLVAAALSKRLAEPEGPEVVLVTTEHSASWFDQMTMDRTRAKFIAGLQDADRHGRFRIYAPVTGLGRTIIVHAKLAIIDDVLLRVGSANMNNRSTGFDSECDVTFEAGGESGEANRAVIGALRTRLVAHWLGCEDGVVEAAQDRAGALGAAIEALRAEGLVRLRPLVRQPIGPLADLIAAYHLGDPVAPGDSWRPWKRKRQIDLDIKRALP